MDTVRRYAWQGAAAVGLTIFGMSLGYALLPGVAGAPAPEAMHGMHGQATPFFEDLLKVYVPRRVCMFHEAPVIWLHLVSDLLIGAAYFSIPIALIVFVRRRPDVAFSWIFWMFALFILACGTTHFVGAVDLFHPAYKLDGLIKLFTAIISVATAVALWPLLPRLVALPSPAQLEARVAERTAELARLNEDLRGEVAARRAVEAERAELLERERAARERAEEADRLKDQFLATLSHELRTPLNAILGWTQVLQRAEPDPARVREALTVIERNARAQARLVDDLLDTSRIARGQMRVEHAPVDFAEVVRAAIDTVQPIAATRNVDIEATLAVVPAIDGDASRLQQVVWNLLSNAERHSRPGGRIHVALRAEAGAVELTVRDEGEGIAPDFLARMFEPFRQADSSITRRHGGLGLGLAIAREIVRLHGGRIEARSEGAGRGASFVVTIPTSAAR